MSVIGFMRSLLFSKVKEKRCLGKKGQFFILGAVVLAFLLFSVVLTVNEVIASDGDNRFSEYANSVERETNRILDFQVYSESEMQNITDYVKILETDFRDREIGGNFLIIYGNSSLMRVKNLGAHGISVKGSSGDELLNGASGSVESKIRVAGVGSATSSLPFSSKTELNLTDFVPGELLEITFNGNSYDFPVSEANQVIFIVQKDVGEETYVQVK